MRVRMKPCCQSGAPVKPAYKFQTQLRALERIAVLRRERSSMLGGLGLLLFKAFGFGCALNFFGISDTSLLLQQNHQIVGQTRMART